MSGLSSNPSITTGLRLECGIDSELMRIKVWARLSADIRRCKVIDPLDMAGSEGRKPWEDYNQLLDELKYYDEGLLERPRMVVANKMDEPQAADNLKAFKRHIRSTPVLSISAILEEGVPAFLDSLRTAVANAPVPTQQKTSSLLIPEIGSISPRN
jgi:GTPase involved in cell partitioning and DNA repair